tara:strand:- start:81 stop:1367 length:1287 start_codon:yes stop_codon:yes gene_type:complete
MQIFSYNFQLILIGLKKYNIFFVFSILTIIGAGILLFILSNGDITGISADFDLYYRPILELKESDCKLLECAKFFNSFNPSNEYIRNWVVSPIYTLFFLTPISLFNSELLFLIQGLILTIVNITLIKEILKIFYKRIFSRFSINLVVFIGTFHSGFLKDSLTNGTMSICLLFILLSIFFFNKNKFLASIFLIIASAIRPNFIFAWFTFLISLLIFRPKKFKSIIWFLIPSFIAYIFSYYYFYASNPGSFTSNIFLTGLRNFDQIYDYILPSLPISNVDELFRWAPSFQEVFFYLINDYRLIYMTIIIYIIKVFHFLGFLGPDLIWDHRGLFLQRLPGLFYSLLFMIPSFVFSNLVIIYNYFIKLEYFTKWELITIAWSILYIYLHSFYLGDTRYLIGFNFIYIITLLKFIKWIYKSNVDLKRNKIIDL